MTTKKSTGYTTELRHCTGSARFGIEAHEAAISTFPRQPSRKDGLGTMCAEHWKAYVKGLRDARIAAAGKAGTRPSPATAKPVTKPKAATRKASSAAKPSANADEVAQAEALIAEVDALPADQMVERVGDDDVQAALETVGGANGGGGEATRAELDEHNAAKDAMIDTPLGEAIDGGSDEHVADDAA